MSNFGVSWREARGDGGEDQGEHEPAKVKRGFWCRYHLQYPRLSIPEFLIMNFFTGQRSQDPSHLLQGQRLQEAHPAQGHTIQGRKSGHIRNDPQSDG